MKDLKDQIMAISQRSPSLVAPEEEGSEEDGDDEFAIDLLGDDGDLE